VEFSSLIFRVEEFFEDACRSSSKALIRKLPDYERNERERERKKKKQVLRGFPQTLHENDGEDL
jgi:hypothetical protein